MVVKTRTAIVAATTAAAIVLFGLLPFSSWEATMMIMTLHKSHTNNNNSYYFVHQQMSSEGYRKHIRHIIPITGIWSGSGGDSAVYSNNANLKAVSFTMIMNSVSPSTSSPTPSKNRLIHSSFRIEEDVIKSLERTAKKRVFH